MELLLERIYPKKTYTIGRLSVNGQRFSDTMEDCDRGLEQYMHPDQLAKMKVYGETAIPKGRYEIKMTYSSKFAKRDWAQFTEGMVPEICKVPCFTGVRIHPLNTAADSLGCIGVGKNDLKGWISQSTAHYRKLVDEYIYPAIKNGEKVFITIK